MVTGEESDRAARVVTDAGWRDLLSKQIREHGSFFFRLALKIVKDRLTAEDVCQQAFMRAWEQKGIEPPALKAWLTTTVIHRSLEVFRRRKSERHALREYASRRPIASESRDASKEISDAVIDAVLKLPKLQQTVVTLRMLHGLSGNETKEILGCSDTQVSRQLYLGFAQLRNLLGADLGGLPREVE